MRFWVWLLGVVTSVRGHPEVTLSQGRLRGTFHTSRGGRNFSAFKGIPYAKVTERFGVAVPADGWAGVRDGSKFGARCAQLEGDLVVGVEDCLFLNVFTPLTFDLGPVTHLPVLVVLETGGFQVGGADHSGPTYFLDHPLLLVTFNYRLNVLGFLATGDHHVPGNMGLKDQLSALKWVRNNIHIFGGDPQQVTLMGESAGGSSVTFHTLSPQAKGLFHRAISMSGSALTSRHFTRDLAPATRHFAHKVGCGGGNVSSSEGLVTCLRRKSVDQLLRGLIPEGNILHASTQVFAATLERSSTGFLPDTPANLLRRGEFQKVPLLMTVTKDEGLLRHSALVMKTPSLLRELESSFPSVAPLAFHFHKFSLPLSTLDLISSSLRAFYFPHQHITLRNLTALYSDSFILHSVKRHILFHAKYAPVHAGVFGFEGVWSQIFQLGLGYRRPLGVAHGDDLQYFFDNQVYPNFPRGSRLFQVSQRVVNMWANFAITGDPNVGGLQWREVESRKGIDSGEVQWMWLGPGGGVREPLGGRLRLWDWVQGIIDKQTQSASDLYL